MGKERYICTRIPFGELQLSDTDKEALKEFAINSFEAQVAKYEEFIADGGPKVNEREWKKVKSTEGTRVYEERKPSTEYPTLLLTGTTWGTVDDCMFGAVSSTSEAMRIKAMYINDTNSGSVLEVVEKPTVEEPFRSLTVRWIEMDLPFASTPLIKKRDYVFVEYMNIVHLSNGERIGCQIYHSISFPQTKELPGRTRANMTVCGMFRQIGPDLVEVYSAGVMDPAGSLVKKLVVPGMATGYLTILKYNHCSEMKKIAWLMRQRHAQAKVSGIPNQQLNCVTCTSSVKDHARTSKGKTCKLCGGYLCSSCTIHRKLAVVGVEGLLEQHKVTFCGGCLQQVRALNPLEIAKEYASGASNQPISCTSFGSSLSCSASD